MTQLKHDVLKEDGEKELYEPMPLDAGEVEGWKEIPIEESGERLVPLGAFSREANSLFTSSVYLQNSTFMLKYK